MNFKVPWITFCFAGLLVCLSGWSLASDRLTEFALNALHPEQLWRIASSHLVHSDITHLVWNVVALIVIGSILERFSWRELVGGIVVGAVGVAGWFFLFSHAQLYVGMSGVLNTLLVILLKNFFVLALKLRDQLVVVVLSLFSIGYVGKIVSELYFEIRWIEVGDWPSAPGAHLAGFIVGLALAGLSLLSRFRKASGYQKHESIRFSA